MDNRIQGSSEPPHEPRDVAGKVAVPADLFARAAHAIRTEFWFRDDEIDALRREASILRSVEEMGMTRQGAAERFDALEASTEPAPRARAISERTMLRFVLRALATRVRDR